MDRRKLTLVPIWLAVAALSTSAWATRAQAQTDERRRPSCVTEQGEPCCDPRRSPDDEQGLADHCPPAGRRHRQAAEGQDRDTERVRTSDDEASEGDPDSEDGNDNGAGNFGRKARRSNGSGRRASSGAPAGGTSGGAPAGGASGGALAGGKTGGAPVGSGGPPTAGPAGNPAGAPGSAAAGGASAATPGPVAVSSPSASAPAA